jgi:hypothetical protein
MPSREKTLAWMTQDCSPRSSSSQSPGKSRAADPDWAAARSPLRGPVPSRLPDIPTILVAKPPPSSLRNHHHEPACSCASNIDAGALHDIGCPAPSPSRENGSRQNALSGGCIRSGIGVCCFPGVRCTPPTASGAGQRLDQRPESPERAPPTALSRLPGMQGAARRNRQQSDRPRAR